jgi:uncharacterized protein
MTKTTHFIGRERELKRLTDLTKKTSASFIVVKGRRRIGKSRLIIEFSKQFEHFYKFEGLAPEENITPIHQLEEFSRQLTRQFRTAKAKYDDWSDALWAVGERVQTGKTLLFFDELSWMGDKDPTFLGKIKNFWDTQLSKNNRLIFVVCSSASGWMEKNLLNSTGFVGRVSLTLTLAELPLTDCNKFWPKNISAHERLKILAVTGGIPKYIEEIKVKEHAEENIKQLCFTEGGFLVKEFEHIFSDLFMRKSSFYKKIVYLLATGAKEHSEIQEALCQGQNLKYYGRISEYLWELEEAGFIKRDRTWNIKTSNDSKLSRYRLQDNYLRFYLRYIEKNLEKIKRGMFASKSLTLLPEWNTIMGFQFENLVVNNKALLHKILGIKADEIVNENPFFQRKTNRTPGCQIDYMVQTKFGSLYICEIKFSKNEIDNSIIKEVQAKINALKFPRSFSYRPVLIHVNGITSDVIDSDYFYSIISVAELLEIEEK